MSLTQNDAVSCLENVTW